MSLLLLVVASMLAAVLLVGVGERLRLPWPVLLDELAHLDREALGISDDVSEQVIDELRARLARLDAALAASSAHVGLRPT